MDARVALPEGTLLDGSYRIERMIGSGGFGITYEAEDVKLGTKVAIKEYCPEEFGYRDASLSVRPKSEQHTRTFEWGRSSFLQEARTLARFRHPSVVHVTRVFEAFSTAYMVMVFEQGQSFEEWLKRLGRLPTQEELDRIAGPILDALEMMHGESFLHRDIAPDNIIVRADGTPVLLDFGAARRAVAEESRSLTGIVKAGYSPQEQYATDGRLQGPWTDIYAFGAMLYRAVTGKVPEESTLRAIDDRMLPALSVGEGKYRPGFLEAIDACLEVHHADRPQSVAQVRSLLLAQPAREIPPLAHVVTAPLAETQKTETTKPTLVPPARRSTKPWWTVAAVIAVGAGVASGLQYTRWQEAKLVADAEAAKKKADDDVAKKAVEEREHREAEAKRFREAEAKRFQEGARLAFEAAQKAERAEQQRREAEAKRKAEEETKREPWRPPPLDHRVLTTAEEGRLKPGDEFQECQDCPRMIGVPAGSFMMGSPASEPQRADGEAQLRVTLARPFAVGKFAVTFDEWDACVADGGCNGYRPGDQGWGRGKRPVIYVNWDDAKAYATWLSRKIGKPYRLLSDAEREYVARAGTTTPFWWGSSIAPQQANYDGSALRYEGGGSEGEYRKATVPVDRFDANPWGLYHVHGNVWEWTEDCWNDSNTGNPGNGSARTTGDCSRRVARGGSWFSYPLFLRAAYRSGDPIVGRSDLRGFRVARTISAELNQGRLSEAAEAWAAVKDTTSIPALEAYIAQFPDTSYADLARMQIAELKKRVAIAEPPKPTLVRPAPLPRCDDGVVITVGAGEHKCMKPGAGKTESFKDCPECPEMVVVPAGEFTMGSPADEAQRSNDEGPQRAVRIATPFAAGKFEVLFAEWDACVAAGGCEHRPADRGWGRGRRPVIYVSWNDITRHYVAWLSRKTGKTYRLLTEAEWEYAARGGTTTPFSTGWTITTDQANFDGNYTYGSNSKGQYRQRTVEVGSYQPNAFGLHDMHGNVWEWVQDCYKDGYVGAPWDGSLLAEAPGCSRRVLRGGSWDFGPGDLRSANRGRNEPSYRGFGIGFRLARTISAELNQGRLGEAGHQRCGEITRSRDAYRDCIAEPDCAWNSNWRYCHQVVREALEAERRADQELTADDAGRPFIAAQPQSVDPRGHLLAVDIPLFRIAIEMARLDAQDRATKRTRVSPTP